MRVIYHNWSAMKQRPHPHPRPHSRDKPPTNQQIKQRQTYNLRGRGNLKGGIVKSTAI